MTFMSLENPFARYSPPAADDILKEDFKLFIKDRQQKTEAIVSTLRATFMSSEEYQAALAGGELITLSCRTDQLLPHAFRTYEPDKAGFFLTAIHSGLQPFLPEDRLSDSQLVSEIHVGLARTRMDVILVPLPASGANPGAC